MRISRCVVCGSKALEDNLGRFSCCLPGWWFPRQWNTHNALLRAARRLVQPQPCYVSLVRAVRRFDKAFKVKEKKG